MAGSRALTGSVRPRFAPDILITIVEHFDYQKFITIEPGKRGGKPSIRGLRITVQDVLEYLASGMTEQKILEDFPELTRDDLRAVYAFAADRERRLKTISS
jgi:uncharacterized protein (DUF433 family)